MDPVTIVPAALSQRAALARLLQACLAELGEPAGYPYLNLYWIEPDRHPYLLRVGAAVVGLALVRRVEGVTEMAEFYVEPQARRRGIGRAAAHRLFERHPGPWHVRSLPGSRAAERFWRSVVPAGAQASREVGQLVFSFRIAEQRGAA